ncbi:hypothetical protein SCLCIDRAFT_33968 [Scleroderma citrinum Foug A]|uniref:Uncharacterized protein n=1 Tax=Scleroderma citrinum Foug A TaxID=1036808 RepID=A0A0C3D3X1_9AGAM|nr:hypothetical protein SCLCIDRAFT_33968 [Scleroderma citrinum Foug A]
MARHRPKIQVQSIPTQPTAQLAACHDAGWSKKVPDSDKEEFDLDDLSISSEDNTVPCQHASDAPSESLPLNPDPLLKTDWCELK